MLMQNFGVTNKEYYGMLWYFLEWSIRLPFIGNDACRAQIMTSIIIQVVRLVAPFSSLEKLVNYSRKVIC